MSSKLFVVDEKGNVLKTYKIATGELYSFEIISRQICKNCECTKGEFRLRDEPETLVVEVAHPMPGVDYEFVVKTGWPFLNNHQ